MQSLIDGLWAGVMSRFRSVVHVLQWLVIGLGLVSLPMPLVMAIEDAETNSGFVDINLPDDPPHYLTITTAQPELKHIVHSSLLVLIASGLILTLVGVVCRAGTILSCIACIVVTVAIVISCSAAPFAIWRLGVTGRRFKAPTVRFTTSWNRASCKGRHSCWRSSNARLGSGEPRECWWKRMAIHRDLGKRLSAQRRLTMTEG